jgi:hypothetical protein
MPSGQSVPSRHDQHHRGVRLQTRQSVGQIPLPGGLSRSLRVGILAAAHRIVNHEQIGPPAGHRAADADREVLAAAVGFPAANSLAVVCKTAAKYIAVLGRRHNISYSSVDCRA